MLDIKIEVEGQGLFWGDILRFAHFSDKNLIEVGLMGGKSHTKL